MIHHHHYNDHNLPLLVIINFYYFNLNSNTKFYIFKAANLIHCQFIFNYFHKLSRIDPCSWLLVLNLHFNHSIFYFKYYSTQLVLQALIFVLNVIIFNFLIIVFLLYILFTSSSALIKFINIQKINLSIQKNLMIASHIFLTKFKFLNFFLIIIQNVFLANFRLLSLNF